MATGYGQMAHINSITCTFFLIFSQLFLLLSLTNGSKINKPNSLKFESDRNKNKKKTEKIALIYFFHIFFFIHKKVLQLQQKAIYNYSVKRPTIYSV